MTKNHIVTILNCYRRPQNLEAQVKAVRGQSLFNNKAINHELWVWCNYHEDNEESDIRIDGVDVVVWSSRNFKFHGRFALGLLADTEYLSYLDDDTIPGPDWYSNCLLTTSRLATAGVINPILGSAGVILNSSKYADHVRVGWPSRNEKIERVDLVGHAWFFNRKVLNALWAYDPVTLQNAEDIQLSAFAQKLYGTQTFCPPHPTSLPNVWGSTKPYELGVDDVAMSNGKVISHTQFFSERDEAIRKCLNVGWKTLKGIQ